MIGFILLLFFGLSLQKGLEVLQRQINRHDCKVVKEGVSFFMSNRFLKLWVDDSPESSLLRCSLLMLTVQEGEIKDFLGLISTWDKHLFMLEVWVLNVTVLLELLHINISVLHSGSPTVISEINCISESLDWTLKDIIADLLHIELLLVLGQHLFILAVVDLAGADILTGLAHVTPKYQIQCVNL